MKIIKELPGAYCSKVELVEIDSQQYVLKTANLEDIANEIFFNKTISDNGLPALKIIENTSLSKNQILMEYIEGSPELEKHRTVENYISWGKVTKKMHSIIFPKPYKVNEEGKLIEVKWPEFIEEEIKAAVLRQQERNTNLDPRFIDEVVQFIRPVANIKHDSFSLVHSDLHSNNVLITERGAILFDNGSSIMYGDALYDLAQAGISFRVGLNSENENEEVTTLLQAFITGYGIDFIQKDKKLFARYMALRALRNHPNIFEPYLVELLKSILVAYT